MSLSSSEHGYKGGTERRFHNNQGGLNDGSSHHLSRNNSLGGHNLSRNNSLGGSSHNATRGGNYGRNKSFCKPQLSSSNSGYDPLGSNSSHSTRSTNSFQHSYKKPVMPAKQQYLAMDCEMVGTVSGESVAARVVLVDWKGRSVFDSYMKPTEAVSDYRTFVSGITEENLKDAPAFADIAQEVQELLHNKILVGHGVDNDLRALGITHPWLMTRDTAYYQPFMRLLETSTLHNPAMSQNGTAAPVWGPRKLKDLSKEKLQRDIQVAGVAHCPVEDAAAALDLYKSHRPRWEACMSTEEKQQQQRVLQMAAAQYAYQQEAYENALMLESSNYNATPLPTSISRSTSRSSSVSSCEDLNMSVHSYFHYNGMGGTSRFQSGFDGGGSNHYSHHHNHHASPDASSALQTGYQPSLDVSSPSYHTGTKSSNSLDVHHSSHGPIQRPYAHRSTSMNEPHNNNYNSIYHQPLPHLTHLSSLEVPSDSHSPTSYNRSSYANNNNATISNTAVY
jgi:RNA exonuclease 4